MKQKLSREERFEKKKQRNIVIIGLIIIAIMIGGMFFMPFGEEDRANAKKLKYKEYQFQVTQNNYLALKVNNVEYYFIYLPQEVENITVDANLAFTRDKIYFVTDLNDSIDNSFSKMMVNQIYPDRLIQDATFDPKDYRDIPVVSCQDDRDIIAYKVGESRAYRTGSCLIIQGNDSSQINMVTHRLMYKALGVMS